MIPPAPRRRRRAARLAVAAALVLVLLAAGAGTAGADPARPTDFRSRVLSVDPPLPSGVELRVVGGDAFLELTVAEGHTVVVPDYASGDDTEPRPYLRFRADGTVEVNDRSAAVSANESRYGTAGGSTDIGAEPEWRVVARDGRYVWHDHRIHWMLTRPPTAVDADRRVDLGGPEGTWTVDLTVDDEPVTVRGELLLLPSPSPVPWLALGLILAATTVGLAVLAVRAGRQPSHRALAALLGVSGLAATAVGWAQWQAIPPGAGGSVLTAAVPAVAVLAAVVALVVAAPKVRLAGLAVAVAALGGWAFLRREALARAVLPTSIPYGLDRGATAVASGVALAGIVILVWRPPVAAPPVRPPA